MWLNVLVTEGLNMNLQLQHVNKKYSFYVLIATNISLMCYVALSQNIKYVESL
jgi:low affinity Fe/Cu permease